MNRLRTTFLAPLLLALALTGAACGSAGTADSRADAGSATPAASQSAGSTEQAGQAGQADDAEPTPSSEQAPPDTAQASPQTAIDIDGSYDDLEHVVLYLDTYGELPSNYVTKKEAREAGWSGGTPSRYIEGASIGGDHFGNYEGLLPRLPRGSQYRECDLDTTGRNSRGAHRLVYTDDGDPSDGCAPYYYTEDHFDSFVEVEVVDGEVMLDE
jgi:guanyl-specific ribonuclease Sa